MRKLLYIVIFFSSSSNAQNLIQNGGFEEYDYCPVNLGEIPIKYWYSPTLNTPDYFHSCVSNNDNDVPNNNFGWQFAQQGEGYVGEMTTYPWDNQFTNRDYLTNRLSGILKEDSTYCLTFYINTPEDDTSGSLYSNIGIYFSNDSIWFNIYDTLPFVPQLETPDNFFYDDTANWIKVELNYIAIGGEKYMTVGNFKGNQNTNLLNLGPSLINYYYFDSFSLVECNPPPPSIEIIIPNIFTPNKDGINDNFNIENLPDNSLLTVYNRWGASVYQSNNYNNDWTGESLSDGVYYYILTLPSGNSTKGTVTILRD